MLRASILLRRVRGLLGVGGAGAGIAQGRHRVQRAGAADGWRDACGSARRRRRGSLVRRSLISIRMPALTQALANPLATDGLGNYTFYAAPGRYEIEICGPEHHHQATAERDSAERSEHADVHFASRRPAASPRFRFRSAATSRSAEPRPSRARSRWAARPVPSTGQANTWTATQTFQGPTPWVDVAAYGARAIVTTAIRRPARLLRSQSATLGGQRAHFQNKRRHLAVRRGSDEHAEHA